MKTLYFAVVLGLACLLGFGGHAYAARNNAHSIDISQVIQIGGTTLKPGNYKLEWQGSGSAVQVSFQQNGKTLVTVSGTLKTNDDQVTQDATVTEGTSSGTLTLKEIRLNADLQLRPIASFEESGRFVRRVGSSSERWFYGNLCFLV